jgi:2,3-bisphosphoglycerate-dependent phosphoglycerate mutase
MILYLLRHAESEANPDLPEPDWPLSTHGREQAQALIQPLTALDIDRVYSSPYRRALDTVAPFARHQGLTIHTDVRLRERTLTCEWLDDYEQAVMATWTNFDLSHPGGESSASCQRRMMHTIRELFLRSEGQTLLISSHGNAISLYLNSLDAQFGFENWRTMRKPDLFQVRANQWKHIRLGPVWSALDTDRPT